VGKLSGVGLSFGYNQLESADHLLDGDGLIKQLVDVVSRGGNFLLKRRATAEGLIPAGQRTPLEKLGAWMKLGGDGIYGTRPVPNDVASRHKSRGPAGLKKRPRWVVVDASGPTELPARPRRWNCARPLWRGGPVAARAQDGRSPRISLLARRPGRPCFFDPWGVPTE